jgi:hypothetical protein
MQQPPQIAPPGLAQVTYAGAMGGGYGTSFQQQQAYGALGGEMAGAGFGNFIGNTAVPAAVYGGQTIAMFGAPMMAKSASSLWRGTGHFLNAADPFTHVGSWGKAGWAAGHGATAWRDLKAAKNIGGALRAGMGVARGGLMAAGSGFLPLAVGMAATEVAIKAGEYVAHGAQENFTGAALMKNIGTQFGGGASHGAEIGRMLHDVGQDVGKSVSEMADMARSMDQMKMFQTTRDVKEFKKRFTEIMDTVKEVARTMQTSVDEALGVVGDLRSQGFYTTADIKTASLKQKARGMASGMSQDQLSQFGAMGSNYARQLGMRGRFGADFAQQQAVGVRTALREGYMSEEDVMERGGPDAVAASLAATQMRFLGSARGRVMIANMMGGGSEMDHNRVNNFLSGDMSLESMVTGAAGRGLGVLTAAGGAQAKENAMQYAGMGMVSIAAAQSKQLGGRFSTLDMLSGMAGGRGQAELLMQQTLAMPETLRQQHEAEYSAAQMADYEERRQYDKLGSKIGRYFNSDDVGLLRGLGTRAQRLGSGISYRGERMYRPVARLFGQERTYESGGESDLAIANEYAQRLQSGSANINQRGRLRTTWSDTEASGRMFGPRSGRAVARDELRAYTKQKSRVDPYGDYIDLGHDKVIHRSDYEKAQNLINDAGTLTEDQSKILQGVFMSTSGDAAAWAKKYLQSQGEYAGSLGTDISREDANAYYLAAATDVYMGKRGEEGSILGDRTARDVAGDKDFLLQLRTRMRKEEGTEDYVGKGRGIGTTGEEQDRFNKRVAGIFATMSSDQFFKVRGIAGVGGEAGLMEAIQGNEETRGVWLKAVRAIQSGDKDKIQDVMSSLEGIDGGDTIHQIMQKSLTDSDFASKFRRFSGVWEDAIGRYAFTQQRGKAYDRFAAGAKRARGRGGGAYDEMLEGLEVVGKLDVYNEKVREFTRSVLEGGIEVEKDEANLLADVFGGERAAGLQNLLGKDTDVALATSRDLGLGLDEKEFAAADEDKRITMVIAALEKKGLLDLAGMSAEGGTTVGDTRVAYVEANSRFVAAVNRFVGNLKTELGEDWMPVDVSDLLTEPK